MKRRLVKQGPSTLMISVPSSWVKKYELNKGDEIDLMEKEGQLIVSTDGLKDEIRKTTIDVTGLSPLINRSIIALYLKGYDEIEVTFDNPDEVRDFQKRIMQELLGFEIIKQTKNNFILKDVTGCEKQEIEDLIKKIFFILSSMSEELANIEKKSAIEQIIDIDSSVNRLVNFSLRVLNKKGYKNPAVDSQMYGLISLLEEIGDSYKNLAKSMSKEKLTKNQINILNESRAFLDQYKEILFKFDKEIMISISKKYASLKKDLNIKTTIDAQLMIILNTIIKINNYLLVMML